MNSFVTAAPELFGEFSSPEIKNVRTWKVNRYKLLSWWDMERFSARAFYLVGYVLGILPPSIRKDARIGEAEAYDLNRPALESTRKHAKAWLGHIEKWCRDIDLKFAIAHTERAIQLLERDASFNQVLNAVDELRQRIADEMKSELFLYVPSEHAKFYGLSDPFGPAVTAAFPSVAYDIREAHNCYALERPTACVFHLMRVLEVSLASLGNVFGLSLDHTNWGPAIDHIEKKVREVRQDDLWKVMPDWKDQLEFYAQAVSYLGITKEAWRNYTAHARGKFTQEEAKQMLESVKLYMQRISLRLTE